MIRSLGIVGTGLMGASVGLAAKRAGVERVVGADADPGAAEEARERGALDAVDEAVEDAELVVVAVPPARTPDAVARVLARSGDATVTDLSSVKGWAGGVADPRLVGGHPVCGSEARGPGAASADLFDGATWFLTPVGATDPERFRLVHGFVAALGAIPVAIGPDAHDRLVALTSHLPHALANLLVLQAGASDVEGHDPLASAGGSLRDMTRVAGANAAIWVDIFVENRQALLAALGEHRRRVERLEAALERADADELRRWIAEARRFRRLRMLRAAYERPEELRRLRVHVPDQPGVLASITQTLGAERINIEDFELHHLSPERGGTVDVLVAGGDEATRAAQLLDDLGYSVSISDV